MAKTPEQIAQENARTTEVGLFNFADAYLLCAKQLIATSPAGLRFSSPIEFLLIHAAELYLKSYLRQKGEDVAALKNLGHHRVCEKAVACGLSLPAEICAIFKFLDQTDAIIESRYIVTGSKQQIRPPQLLAMVDDIRAKVKINHETAGVKLLATGTLP